MIECSKLENGLQVVTNRLENRESIGFGIWVRVGSRHEAKAVTGISHFVEHMLFKGTKNRTTRQLKEQIEGVGGSMNAFTGEESTCYFVKIPKTNFEAAFDVLQDMVNNSVLKQEEFDRERTVILEEIKMYLDQPSQHVHELVTELLWPSQPLGRPIAGTARIISKMKRSDLASHVRKFYHPKNLVVTACGDVEHADVADLAQKYFGSKKRRPSSQFKPAIKKKRSRAQRIYFLDKKTEQTHFVIGFHGLPRAHKDRFRLAILNIVMGGNMSSRLFEEVREQRGLAYEIRSGLSFFEGAGSFTVSAGVEPARAADAIKVIMRELGRVKKELVPEVELKRAKEYFLGQMSLGLEDTLENILWFGERVLYGGPVPDLEIIRSEIENVTVHDLQRLSNLIFKNNNIHLALIGPADKRYCHRVQSRLILK